LSNDFLNEFPYRKKAFPYTLILHILPHCGITKDKFEEIRGWKETRFKAFEVSWEKCNISDRAVDHSFRE
jgi:hypothetical protein